MYISQGIQHTSIVYTGPCYTSIACSIYYHARCKHALIPSNSVIYNYLQYIRIFTSWHILTPCLVADASKKANTRSAWPNQQVTGKVTLRTLQVGSAYIWVMISSRCKHDRKTGDSVASLSDDITSAWISHYKYSQLSQLSAFFVLRLGLRNQQSHGETTTCTCCVLLCRGTTRTCSWITTAWIKTNQAIFHPCRVAYWHFTQNSKWKLSDPRLKPLRDPANDALEHFQDQTSSRRRVQNANLVAIHRNSKTTFTNIPAIDKSQCCQCCHDDGCYRQNCIVWRHVKRGVSSVFRFVCLRRIEKSLPLRKLGASLSASARSFCKACLSLSATGVHWLQCQNHCTV